MHAQHDAFFIIRSTIALLLFGGMLMLMLMIVLVLVGVDGILQPVRF
jgi:hypothetical protein